MLRFLTVALSCSSVAAFTLPSAARPNVVMRCDAPEANMGRRAFAGLRHTLLRARSHVLLFSSLRFSLAHSVDPAAGRHACLG